jgi:hypothetical protein
MFACLVVAGVGFFGSYYLAGAGPEEREALQRGLEHLRHACESRYRRMLLGIVRVEKSSRGTQ